jgi:hypothetical protein
MEAEHTKLGVGKQVRIKRLNPDGIRSVPANDLIITHSKQEFYLTFSSIEPPPILEEKDLEDLEQVDALARSKLVISLDFSEAILKALSMNIEAFKQEMKTHVPKE